MIMSIDTAVDSITENLLYILPLLHRKLLRVEFSGVAGNLSRLHFVILKILERRGPRPISEIGKRLFIPKPQMTALVDRLIEFDLVERIPDTEDRRVININLTSNGNRTLEECDKVIKESIRKKMATLTQEDLEEMVKCTASLRRIGSKLE